VKRLLPRLLLFACALLAAGCGYRSGPVERPGVNTIAVPVFENDTLEQGLAIELTEALIKEIEFRTPWKVVSADRADTILAGRLASAERRLVSRRPDGGVPEEIEVEARIDFTWEDSRSGELLLERRGLATVSHHAPARPAGEPFEVAGHEIAGRIAERIVSSLRNDW